MNEKFEKLKSYLKSLGNIAVAFSGGVDSTFLLHASHEVLGDAAVAITTQSALCPKREQNEASDFCKKNNIRQIVVAFDALSIQNFSQNPKDRCYICKRAIFEAMISAAKKEGFEHIAEGSNLDDTGDYRPGLKAVSELGVLSPLKELGFTKEEIRALSKEAGLKTWDKPSFACLASRFAYGQPITKEKLQAVENAEEFLRGLDFTQFRARVHDGGIVRIELLPEQMQNALLHREKICAELKRLGFDYVSLDLQGYRTGSMNLL